MKTSKAKFEGQAEGGSVRSGELLPGREASGNAGSQRVEASPVARPARETKFQKGMDFYITPPHPMLSYRGSERRRAARRERSGQQRQSADARRARLQPRRKPKCRA